MDFHHLQHSTKLQIDRDSLLDFLSKVGRELAEIQNLMSRMSKTFEAQELSSSPTALTPTLKLTLDDAQPTDDTAVDGVVVETVINELHTSSDLVPATSDSLLHQVTPVFNPHIIVHVSEVLVQANNSSTMGFSTTPEGQVFDNFSHRAEQIFQKFSIKADDLEIIGPVLSNNMKSESKYCGNTTLIMRDSGLPLIIKNGEGKVMPHGQETTSKIDVSQMFPLGSRRRGHYFTEYELYKHIFKQHPFDPGSISIQEKSDKSRLANMLDGGSEVVGEPGWMTANVMSKGQNMDSVLPATSAVVTHTRVREEKVKRMIYQNC